MSQENKSPLPIYGKFLDLAKPFVFGGSSGIIATTCIQPLDTVKVRLQLAGEGVKGGSSSFAGTFRSILANEGPGAFYSGIGAAWLRQAVYGTSRLGLFRVFSNKLQQSNEDPTKPISFVQKAIAGLGAGALGSFIGNPADLALVRMQADGTLPVEQRRNYTGVFDAISRTVREEGVLTLWRGSLPTMVRAMAMNVGMLATYDQVKEELTAKFGAGNITKFGSSIIAGVVAATATLPFDMLKTRIQKQQPDAKGNLPYKNMLDAGVKIVSQEGPLALYKGWGVFCTRVAPHAVITLCCMEFLNHSYTEWRVNYE